MTAQSALETQARRHTYGGENRQIRPINPMRLILRKETRAKPVDCMQNRIPGENIADPIRHHSWYVKDSRTKIQCARQLRPNLIPRFEERVDDSIDQPNPTTKQ